jgi:CrcB protein
MRPNRPEISVADSRYRQGSVASCPFARKEGMRVTRMLLVAVGGVLGALSRYYLQGWILDRTGPSIVALFVINISGSFAIGLVTTLAQERGLINPDVRLLLTTGFLGAYTTFSSWMFESVQLIQVGNIARATVNLFGSIAAGLVAVYLGIVLARAI